MKLICPSCGAVASAEAWASDADARQCIRIIGELPGEIARRALAYLALFRPANGKGLRWSTALRLLSELQLLVKDPYIQWEGKVSRPNSAAAWGQAMEQVTGCPPKRLPLKSHGYLRSVAYDIANELDRAGEKRQIKLEQAGRVRYPEIPERIDTGGPERISFEDLKAIADKNFRSRKKGPQND